MYITHLANAVTAVNMSNETSVGTVMSGNCYGPDHVHYSYKNTVANKSCYVNYSNSTHTAGMQVNYAAPVGLLGSINSNTRQVCASLPTTPPALTNLDILSTEKLNTAGTAVAYRVGWGNGSGTNYGWSGTTLNNNVAPTHTEMADINNDGNTDIVVIEPTGGGGVRYLIAWGGGNGGFSLGGTNLTNNTPVSHMAVGNFNNDAFKDLLATEIVNSTTVRYMVGWGNGSGNFNWQVVMNGNKPTQLAVADINKDGNDEFIETEPVGGNPNIVNYVIGWKQSGNSFSWGGTNLTNMTKPNQLLVKDFNNDSRFDIIAPEPNGQPNGAVAYRVGWGQPASGNPSAGSGGFTWGGTSLNNNVPATHVTAADVNKDNVLDIIATEPNGNGSIRYMAGIGVKNAGGNGTGGYNWQLTNLTGNTAILQLMVGKVDGD